MGKKGCVLKLMDEFWCFSFQGRTALWDAILLFCHRVNVSFGGVVRGLHLNSPALSILPVLDTDVGDQFTRDVPRSH